ncbi:hypothetical protein [Dongshaea marina]|uniref:hypothetical protein n=1 Tax=Dongshaea marina TaxID=2047966 RepID=UPI000D3E7C05|nr:hypothetical protein [Dongshaea marina]
MQWKEHGSFEMKLQGNIMLLHVLGRWNVETTQHFVNAYQQQMVAMIKQPWGQVTDLSQWELSPPDIWEHIYGLARWMEEHNQVCEAFVCSLSIQKMLMKKRLETTPKVRKKFFTDTEPALDWCRNELTETSSRTLFK